jgi:hypothetical protein
VRPRHRGLRRARRPRHEEECVKRLMRVLTKHFHAKEHPLVQSFQSDEDGIRCYVDEVVMEPVD